MLIEVMKADTLVLFLILVGKLLVLPIEYDVGCRSLVNGLSHVEECSLYLTLLSVLTINGCCTLSNAFSASIDMIT